MESSQGALGAPSDTGAGALLALHCAARAEHAELLAQHAPSRAASLVAPALELVRGRAGEYHAVHAAAVMLEQAQRAGQEPLPTQQLQVGWVLWGRQGCRDLVVRRQQACEQQASAGSPPAPQLVHFFCILRLPHCPDHPLCFPSLQTSAYFASRHTLP